MNIFRLLLIGSFLFGNTFIAASQTNECDQLLKAAKADYNHHGNKAIKLLKSFSKQYPEHFLHDEIELKIGDLYRANHKFDQSIEWYSKLINQTKYPESDEVFQILCDGLAAYCPGFLNQDRLLVLQHEAWIGIFEIAMETKDYPLAAKALLNADKYYRFWYGCGTGDLEESLRLSLLYARYYESISLPDSAIAKLLPGVLEAKAFPVPFFEDVVAKAVKLLKQKYTGSELENRIEATVNDLYYDTLPAHNNDSVRIYYIRFLDIPIKVAPAYLMGHQLDTGQVKDYIRKSEFVKKLLN